jgi:transcriptional regulator with XRE-family HTH domain
MGKPFGNYLKALRDARQESQSQVAAAATKEGSKKITQPLLTQLEKGDGGQPDAQVINQLAKALKVRPGELVFRLALDIIEDYKEKGAELDDQDESILETWRAAAFKEWPQTQETGAADVTAMHVDDVAAGMRSMAEFVRENDLRDIDSLAQWQKDYPNLEIFWVIAPNFVDSSHPQLRETVLNNVRKKVHYYYFIKQGDADSGGPFYVLLDTLAFESRRDHGHSALTREDIEKYVHAVEFFPKDIVGLIPSDVVIANPHSQTPAGFRSIRSGGQAKFGVAIDNEDLSRLIGRYRSYFGTEKVFPSL